MTSRHTNSDLAARIRHRLDSLTKPPGSLGQLEDIALRFALIRGDEMPVVSRKTMFVFCGDHGVTAEGVSAYPSGVTAQMVANFLSGGAAISVLCKRFDIHTNVVDAGVNGLPIAGTVDRKIAEGTRNFAREPAMTRDQVEQALTAGRELAEDAALNYDLAGVGEMGIGNTTAAAAILSAVSGRDPAETAGPGTGLSQQGIANKAGVIRRALEFHRPDPRDGVGLLAAVGGCEIAMMTGFLLGAAATRLPVVLDGFTSCSAALVARVLDPAALDTAFYSHLSAEPGHRLMLELLRAEAYFDLGMRLGEGTGSALMMQVIDAAVTLYREMATFESAGVSGPAQ